MSNIGSPYATKSNMEPMYVTKSNMEPTYIRIVRPVDWQFTVPDPNKNIVKEVFGGFAFLNDEDFFEWVLQKNEREYVSVLVPLLVRKEGNYIYVRHNLDGSRDAFQGFCPKTGSVDIYDIWSPRDNGSSRDKSPKTLVNQNANIVDEHGVIPSTNDISDDKLSNETASCIESFVNCLIKMAPIELGVSVLVLWPNCLPKNKTVKEQVVRKIVKHGYRITFIKEGIYPDTRLVVKIKLVPKKFSDRIISIILDMIAEKNNRMVVRFPVDKDIAMGFKAPRELADLLLERSGIFVAFRREVKHREDLTTKAKYYVEIAKTH